MSILNTVWKPHPLRPGQLSSMVNINALAQIPIGNGTIDAGQNVSVIALDRYFQG